MINWRLIIRTDKNIIGLIAITRNKNTDIHDSLKYPIKIHIRFEERKEHMVYNNDIQEWGLKNQNTIILKDNKIYGSEKAIEKDFDYEFFCKNDISAIKFIKEVQSNYIFHTEKSHGLRLSDQTNYGIFLRFKELKGAEIEPNQLLLDVRNISNKIKKNIQR